MQITQSQSFSAKEVADTISNGDYVVVWKTNAGLVSVWNRNRDKALAFFRSLLRRRINAEIYVFPSDGSLQRKLGGQLW